MTLIGHNRGPALAGGGGWQSHCWRVAREALLPTLPVEVVRLRVKRAKDLGLPYKTYADIRAQTGHDIVAFLFASNSLQVGVLSTCVPAERVAKPAALQAGWIGPAVAPLAASALGLNRELDAAHPAPFALDRLPADRVVLVGEGVLERDWVAAGRLVGWVPAEHYFSA